MTDPAPYQPQQKKIGQTIWSDLKGADFHLGRDLKELYYFYLDDEARAKVARMGRVKRWIYVSGWMLKSMFLKLTPTRRILLLIAVILGLQVNRQSDALAGMLILLFILILELKDKLLAQDELAAGRAVQFALMPERSPRIPGWTSGCIPVRPMTWVEISLIASESVTIAWGWLLVMLPAKALARRW